MLDTPPTPTPDDLDEMDDTFDSPMLDWQDAADGDDEEFDSSEQGSEDEPDWQPLDPDTVVDDYFNANYRDDIVSLVGTLQTLGVTALDANRYASQNVHSVRHNTSEPTFVELYGTGNIMRLSHGRMRNLNVRGLSAFDLRTCKPDGTPWNFARRSDRTQAYRYIKEHRPTWIIGSPPCTPFSTWNSGVNAAKMDPAARAEALRAGRMHLTFVVSLHRLQLRGLQVLSP